MDPTNDRLKPRGGTSSESSQPIRFAGSVLGAKRHVCAFFHNPDEEYRILLPFIKEGFERGEKAFHIVDPKLRVEHARRLASASIDDVERLLAPLETFFDERKQNPVFFVGAVEERADMTLRAKHRAREPNRLAAFTRSSPAGLHTAIGEIHRSSPSDRRPPRPTAHWHRGNRRQLWPAPAPPRLKRAS